MSSDDIEPFDWSRGFFGRRGLFDDMFRGFDEMRREMERGFEGIEKRIPKRDKRVYHARRWESKRSRANGIWLFNDCWTGW
jgi:hypothetical protein